mgnify:CR=1 FL=1
MNKDELFSEAPYYNGYKEIRNQLRGYDPAKLIGMCLHFLHKPYSEPIEYVKRHPWCVLLLIKWILVDDQFDNRNRPAPSETQTIRLIQKVIDLSKKVRLPSQHDYIALFLRAMVFQQILYQQNSSITQSARQMLYFGGLDESHYLAQTFKARTGLSLNRFLELSLALHVAFVDNPVRHRIGYGWFKDFVREGESADITRFLGLLSAPLTTVRASLRARDARTQKNDRVPRGAYEYVEQTPLMQTPLLLVAHDEYVVIDHRLLINCLENFVYWTLREFHVQNFMSHFGPIFEEYVRLAVDYTRLGYRDEADVKALLGAGKQGQNLIDFVIADGDANVFVEAKAAEMNYRATVTHDPEELAKLLDASLLKAIKQANRVIADLAQKDSHDQVFKPKSENYLLVVTYANTNIGNGRALADSVGLAAIEAFIADHPGGLQVPIENMYFLTIHEFEQLVAHVAAGSTGLVEALKRAKAADADPTTSSMVFLQHLHAWGMNTAGPDYLVERTTRALDKIAEAFE